MCLIYLAFFKSCLQGKAINLLFSKTNKQPIQEKKCFLCANFEAILKINRKLQRKIRREEEKYHLGSNGVFSKVHFYFVYFS
jgi:hypothetical protein